MVNKIVNFVFFIICKKIDFLKWLDLKGGINDGGKGVFLSNLLLLL